MRENKSSFFQGINNEKCISSLIIIKRKSGSIYTNMFYTSIYNVNEITFLQKYRNDMGRMEVLSIGDLCSFRTWTTNGETSEALY